MYVYHRLTDRQYVRELKKVKNVGVKHTTPNGVPHQDNGAPSNLLRLVLRVI
jgi:hypothetical protein